LGHIELLTFNGFGLVVEIIWGFVPQDLAVILVQVVPLGSVAGAAPRYAHIVV